MTTFLKIVLLILVVVVSSSDIVAQDSAATESEFRAYLKKSVELTKDSPFRNNTTVEMGETSTTNDWKPYSSWVIENLFPDRSHFKYTSRGQGETIQIGKIKYARASTGPWTSAEEERGASVLNPASPMSFGGAIVDFYNLGTEVSIPNATVFRVIGRPEPGTEDLEKKIVTWTFWFDEKGILYKHEGIAFNGRNWVRTTQIYTYEPDIQIEAPIQ